MADVPPPPLDGPPTPSLWVRIMAPILFCLCWSGLAFRWPYLPVGRTLSTLTCALLCVATRVLTGQQALAAVNLETLALLFGSMIMSSLLEREGFFKSVQRAWCAGLPNDGKHAAHHLLMRVALSSGLLSALFTNDSWCVVGTPVLLRLCARFRLPYAPFLLALATSANIGSACSPVGNPQNMLIATASGIGFSQFLEYLLLPSLLTLVLNAFALMLVYHTQLSHHAIIWTEAHMEREEAKDTGVSLLARIPRATSPSSDPSREPSPRSAVLRRHSADESGVLSPVEETPLVVGGGGGAGRAAATGVRVDPSKPSRVRKPSASSIVAEEMGRRHSGADDAVAAAEGTLEDAAPDTTSPLFDPNPFLIDMDDAGSSSSSSSLRRPLARDEEFVPLEAEGDDQLSEQKHGDLRRVHRPRENDTSSSSSTSSSSAGARRRPPEQTLYPDLDLRDSWARAEYIRRCQLEFFYGVHHQTSSADGGASNGDNSDGKGDKSSHGHGAPPPRSPALSYVASPRYAPPPLPLPGDETALAARARARAHGVASPSPAAGLEHDEEGMMGFAQLPSTAASSRHAASALPTSPSAADASSSSSPRSHLPQPVGRLVMQPPSYSSLRVAIVPPAPPSNPLTLWLASRGWPHHAPSRVTQFSLVLLGTLIAFLAGVPLAWAALGGAVAMLLLDGVDPDSSGLWVGGGVDWALLIFFSALFMVVEALRVSEWPQQAWEAAAPYLDVSTASGVALYALLVIVGSNTVSNVPLVLILAPSLRALPSPTQRHASWLLLAFISTLAGNLTLVGSVANLIVVARARPWYQLGFIEYAKFGAWTTCLWITLGVAITEMELL